MIDWIKTLKIMIYAKFCKNKFKKVTQNNQRGVQNT